MKKASVFYFLLFYTLIFTFPVFWGLFSKIPGKYSDTYQVWGKALGFRNIIESQGLGGALRWQFENFQFSPVEAIGWIQTVTNSFMGYNLVWLFSFFSAAGGMFLLVKYLTGNSYAGILSGIIFSFSPFHISQAISTNIGTMHYEWLPFFILFLLRFLRELKIKDFLGALIFLILIALTEHQLLAFTLLFTVFLVIFFLVKNFRIIFRFKFWLYGAGGTLLLFLAVKLIFGGLFFVAESSDNYLDPGSDQVRRYSADGIDFLIPSAQHPFWGEKFNYLREETEANQTGRQSNFLGYSVIFLALLSLFAVKRFLIRSFFLGTIFLFAVLSLGPYLHWQGKIYQDFWMPYSFLYEHVPYWYIIRTVNRVFVIALLGLAVASGFGLNNIFKLFSKKRKDEDNGVEVIAEEGKEIRAEKSSGEIETEEKTSVENQKKETNYWWPAKLIFWFFLLIISLEYLTIPVPTLSLEYSNFYNELKKKEGDFSILDIPGATSYDYGSKLMIYDGIHQKKNLAGIDFARVVEDKWDLQRNTPIINDLLYSLPLGGKPPNKEIVNDYYYNLGTKILNYNRVEYIIVSREYLNSDKKFDGQSYENIINFIDGHVDADLVWEDDYLIAYKVNKSEHLNGWYLALDLRGGYWDKKEGATGSVTRFAKDGARINLVNMGDRELDIRLLFDVRIEYFRELEIYLNGQKQDSLKIKNKKENQEVLLRGVKPGTNEISFRIYDLEKNPVESYDLKRGVKFSDLRTLSAEK